MTVARQSNDDCGDVTPVAVVIGTGVEPRSSGFSGRAMPIAVVASCVAHALAILLLLPVPTEGVGGAVEELDAISVDLVVIASPAAGASQASQARAESAGAGGRDTTKPPPTLDEDAQRATADPPAEMPDVHASPPTVAVPPPVEPSDPIEALARSEVPTPIERPAREVPQTPAPEVEAGPPAPDPEPSPPVAAVEVTPQQTLPVPEVREAPPTSREATRANIFKPPEIPAATTAENAEPRRVPVPEEMPPAAPGASAPATAASTASAARDAKTAAMASPGAVAAFARRVAQALARTPPRRVAGAGTVHVAFTVGRTGGLEHIAVKSSSGSARLDGEAIAAVGRANLPTPPAGASDSQRSFVIPYHFRRR